MYRGVHLCETVKVSQRRQCRTRVFIGIFKTAQSLPLVFPFHTFLFSTLSLPAFSLQPLSPPPFPSSPFSFHLLLPIPPYIIPPVPVSFPGAHSLTQLGGLGSAVSSLSGSERSPAHKRLVVYVELKTVPLVIAILIAPRFYDVRFHKTFFSRVQYVVDPRDKIFTRVRTPEPRRIDAYEICERNTTHRVAVIHLAFPYTAPPVRKTPSTLSPQQHTQEISGSAHDEQLPMTRQSRCSQSSAFEKQRAPAGPARRVAGRRFT